MTGYVQVYTGDGKGKTTAALGLVLRAWGSGLSVLVAQFLKQPDTGEYAALSRLGDGVEVRCYGTGIFVRGTPPPGEIAQIRAGLDETHDRMISGGFDLVVLDEANVAVHLGVLLLADLVACIDARPPAVELVITGRHAHRDVIARADLVTEMAVVKHYFDAGVPARKGIEK